MAGIDKIYGSNIEYENLWSWLSTHRPQYIKFMYSPFDYTDSGYRAISNFPNYINRWLYKNCPLEWLKTKIYKQYNHCPYCRSIKIEDADFDDNEGSDGYVLCTLCKWTGQKDELISKTRD